MPMVKVKGQDKFMQFPDDMPVEQIRRFLQSKFSPQPESFGLRIDGTEKGSGFFGLQDTADGRVMSEFSIGVGFGGKETQIPTLVPTLTFEELEELKLGEDPSDAIVEKAIAHARQRIAAGRSPFIEEGEEVTQAPIRGNGL